MKLRLEVYERVALLIVTETVSTEETRILFAGVAHFLAQYKGIFLVDLSHAQFAGNAYDLFANEAISDQANLHWIGGPSEVCKFSSLEVCLDELKFPELSALSQKVELELQRDSLVALIEGREKVKTLIEVSGRSIADLEQEYIALNRALRAAQTQIINRFLDPAFSDMFKIPEIDESTRAKVWEALDLKAETPKAAEAPSTPAGEKKSLYDYLNLTDAVKNLREEIKELSKKISVKFIAGADRLVSLIMENDALHGRIKEVRNVWLRQLESDSQINQQDFLLGFEPRMVPKTEPAGGSKS